MFFCEIATKDPTASRPRIYVYTNKKLTRNPTGKSSTFQGCAQGVGQKGLDPRPPLSSRFFKKCRDFQEPAYFLKSYLFTPPPLSLYRKAAHAPSSSSIVVEICMPLGYLPQGWQCMLSEC